MFMKSAASFVPSPARAPLLFLLHLIHRPGEFQHRGRPFVL
jgi:hypothetical protein